MGFFGDLVAGGAKGVLEGAGNFAVKVREAITGEAVLTADQKADLLARADALEGAAQAAAATFDTVQMKGQIDLLKIDQSSPSLFKSGWRPLAGWVCAFGLFYDFLFRPLLPWILKVSGVEGVPDLPPLDMGTLMGLLGGMLGLGTMRSFEKVRNPSR